MAKKTKRGRSQDRKSLASGQDYEVRYEVSALSESCYCRRAGGTNLSGAAFPYMRRIDRAWRALNARMLQYYSLLLNDVPRDLASVSASVQERRRRNEAPKLDRIRPGGPPHVRMPSKR